MPAAAPVRITTFPASRPARAASLSGIALWCARLGLAMTQAASSHRVRVDKWLWAARFYKTRSLATEAVEGGKVHVNGDRVKAARPLKEGDRVRVRRGTEEFDVVVTGLAEHRGTAAAAQALYK